MVTTWLILTVLAQSATITYEPNAPEEKKPPEAPPAVISSQELPPLPPIEKDLPPVQAETPPAAPPATPPPEAEQQAEVEEEEEGEEDETAEAEKPAEATVAQRVEAAPPALIAPGEPPPRGRSLFRGASELTAYSLPSGTPDGSQDMYLNLLPIISVDTGDNFGFELGATLRLRVFDDPPEQRDRDYGHILRRADWDEPSDFGQVLRELRLFSDGSPVTIRLGPQFLRSVGRGHLVSRYSNRLNPDYHPAGASIGAFLGPVYTEVFASDILAARLFVVDSTLDIAKLVGQPVGQFHAGVSVAHDFGLAGGVSPSITLLQVDGDYALYRDQRFQAFAYAGLGTRMLTPDFSMGALLGVSADASLDGGAQLGGKLEARRVGGGFRFGMFGPAYELARFSDTGLALTPIADARLPDGFSVYAEGQLGLGSFGDPGLSRAAALLVSASGEYFTFGRVDVDAAVTARLAEGTGALTGRFTAVDLTGTPRWQGAAEGRYRFARSFYAVAEAGVVFFPQAGGGLSRGVFAGVGVGADFSH